jgi:hypothetical protein
VRLREAAASLGITERSAHAIVADLTASGYVVKQKHGRRNRYQIQTQLPLPEPASQEPAIGDVLAVLVGDGPAQRLRVSAAGHEHADMDDGDQYERPETRNSATGPIISRYSRPLTITPKMPSTTAAITSSRNRAITGTSIPLGPSAAGQQPPPPAPVS